jgi:hypothetical protein
MSSPVCPPCGESFNHVFGGGEWFFTDMCDAFSQRRPTMYVDGDLCVTPTVRPTWSKLKTIYR